MYATDDIGRVVVEAYEIVNEPETGGGGLVV
jgi:hypothetical protein